MLKIQSDGKGYGKPVCPFINPELLIQDNVIIDTPDKESYDEYKELTANFDRDHPTLPLYLPNNEPYMVDDMVDGERAKVAIGSDGKVHYHLLMTETFGRLGYTVQDCYIVHPVVKEQAEVKTELDLNTGGIETKISFVKKDIKDYLKIVQNNDLIIIDKSEAAQLRDFLNQLPL